jgi:hypothetical protein
LEAVPVTGPDSPLWALRFTADDVVVRPITGLHHLDEEKAEFAVFASAADMNRVVSLIRAGLRASGPENVRPSHSIERGDKSREERL